MGRVCSGGVVIRIEFGGSVSSRKLGWEILGGGLIPRAIRVRKFAGEGEGEDPEDWLKGVGGGFRRPPRPSRNGLLKLRSLLPFGGVDELSMLAWWK